MARFKIPAQNPQDRRVAILEKQLSELKTEHTETVSKLEALTKSNSDLTKTIGNLEKKIGDIFKTKGGG